MTRATFDPPRRHPAHLIGLAVILLYALGVRAVLLDQPFSRNAEGVGAFYGQLARNYLRHSFVETRGVPVQSVGTLPGARLTYYHHHPPLVPLVVAGSYALLGDGEWQTRLPAAIFTLACVVAVYWLLAAHGRPRAGLIAAALFASVPMTVFYGGHPDVINTQLVFFILLAVAAYRRLHESPTIGRVVLLCLAFAPAAWTDWPAFYIVPVVCAHWALTHRPRAWVWIVPFGLWSVLMFALVYGHIAVVVDNWTWMSAPLEKRTDATHSDRGSAITLVSWLEGVHDHNAGEHTLPVVLLGLVWLITFGWRVRRTDPAATPVRLLLAFAGLHVVVGRQSVVVHPWWWWLLTPGLVMAAGLLLDAVAQAVSRPTMVGGKDASATGRILEEEVLETASPQQRARVAFFHPAGVNIALVLLLVAFATWTTAATLPRFLDPALTQGGMNYTEQEIGQAIRLASGGDPNGAVVLAYNDSYDLPLWYYGDRPLKLAVWDEVTLMNRSADGHADLPFWFRQDHPPAAVGVVIPKAFADTVPGYIAFLRDRYPMVESEKFLIFDLRSRRDGTADERG
ncbi:MAG: ArnT family glycosyltransferase [Tepidisphaeraceae bacterium]